MAMLGYGAGLCGLVGVCLFSPPVPPPDGAWQFQRAALRSGSACSTVLTTGEGQASLTLALPTQGDGLLTAYLAGYLAGGSAVPAGPQPVPGTIEITGIPPMRLVASGAGGEEGVLRLDILDPRPLGDLAGLESEYGILWLDLPGRLTRAFPLAGWREAMTRLAACAG